MKSILLSLIAGASMCMAWCGWIVESPEAIGWGLLGAVPGLFFAIGEQRKLIKAAAASTQASEPQPQNEEKPNE